MITETEVRARLALGDPTELSEWWVSAQSIPSWNGTREWAAGYRMHWGRLVVRLANFSGPHCSDLRRAWEYGIARDWRWATVEQAPNLGSLPKEYAWRSDASEFCPVCLSYRLRYREGEISEHLAKRLEDPEWRIWTEGGYQSPEGLTYVPAVGHAVPEAVI